MGWLWSSTPASSENNVSGPPNAIPNSPASSPLTPSPPTADEIAEKEFQSFLQELEADEKKESSTKYKRIPKQRPSTTYPSSTDPSNLPLSEQLLPRTMSCREAFDAAFYCNSLGGQFNNLYRYGTVRACSDNWNDFWFCMRTRGYGKVEKERAIMARYREKERLRYQKGPGDEIGAQKSSEDIWRSRERKVEWGTTFIEEIEVFEGDDREWNRAVQEERKRIAG